MLACLVGRKMQMRVESSMQLLQAGSEGNTSDVNNGLAGAVAKRVKLCYTVFDGEGKLWLRSSRVGKANASWCSFLWFCCGLRSSSLFWLTLRCQRRDPCHQEFMQNMANDATAAATLEAKQRCLPYAPLPATKTPL